MEPQMSSPMDCKVATAAIPDLLFDPAAASAAAREHLQNCTGCQAELGSMQRTMQVLEHWEAPEPSPFWSARMGAMLREEQARPAGGWAGWMAQLRTRLWVSNYTLRPAAGVALGLVMAVGGGTWFELSGQPAAPQTQASSTVRDLQSLNENAQVFQQLSALDGPDTGTQGDD